MPACCHPRLECFERLLTDSARSKAVAVLQVTLHHIVFASSLLHTLCTRADWHSETNMHWPISGVKAEDGELRHNACIVSHTCHNAAQAKLSGLQTLEHWMEYGSILSRGTPESKCGPPQIRAFRLLPVLRTVVLGLWGGCSLPS